MTVENKTPAALRTRPTGRETRCFDLSEMRVDDADGKLKIRGHAAVFNRWSELIGGMFKERIEPGAFAKAIKKDDIRALFNHDPNYVLGRTKNGTLTLEEDDKGLYVEIDPPDTQFARDLQTSIRRGDITQMSFSFEVEEDEWNKEMTERVIKSFKRIWDVSPVTFPAYPQTSVKVRSILAQAGVDFDALNAVLECCDGKNGLTPEEREIISKSINALGRLLPQEAPVESGARDSGYQAQLDILRRRLTLAEIA